MKKIKIIVPIVLCIMLLAGCQKAYVPGKENGKMNIVCTTFPQYDWTKNLIVGMEDQYEVKLLLNQGTDMHSYQPTAEDVVVISECDLLIYGGGESEEWVHDAIKESDNNEMRTLCLMEAAHENVKEEVVVEGMQSNGEEEEEDSAAVIGDEHIWLSLKNAKLLVTAIEEEIVQLDPKNRNLYDNNLESYVNRLDALDKEYEEAVANATYKTVLFGDRFPFLYLMEDYGLSYYAAFSGCSAETEASFDTITFLAEKLDAYDLPCVLVLENSDGKLANTIISSSKRQSGTVVNMHAMQSVTKKDIDDGTTYLGLMKQNLEALKKAIY